MCFYLRPTHCDELDWIHYVGSTFPDLGMLWFEDKVYCPECPPGSTIVHPGGQQKKFLLSCL